MKIVTNMSSLIWTANILTRSFCNYFCKKSLVISHKMSLHSLVICHTVRWLRTDTEQDYVSVGMATGLTVTRNYFYLHHPPKAVKYHLAGCCSADCLVEGGRVSGRCEERNLPDYTTDITRLAYSDPTLMPYSNPLSSHQPSDMC
jgi:hypothetical protein